MPKLSHKSKSFISPHGGDRLSFVENYGSEPLDFSISLNPLGMPQGVREALHRMAEAQASYPDIHMRNIKKTLLAYEKEQLRSFDLNYSLESHEIVLGNGAAELIFSLVQALMPKKALLVEPCFSQYRKALESFGTEIITHQLTEAEDFQLTETLIGALEANLDLVFLCNPMSPSARLIKPELIKEIVQHCEKNNIHVIVDECFIDLSDKPEFTTLSLLSNTTHLTVLKALTKSHALAGLRLGYGFCGPDLAHLVSLYRQDWAVNSFAQEAGIAALEDTSWLEKSRNFIKDERKKISDVLEDVADQVIQSEANYILFKMKDSSLFEFLAQKGILVRDCSNFQGLDERYFRIGLRSASDNEKLILSLKEYGGLDG